MQLPSAVVFGAAYINVYQFAIGFRMGLGLGWRLERTRSMCSCILPRQLFSASVTVMASLQPDVRLANDATWPAVLAIDVMLAVGFAGAFVLRGLPQPARGRH